MRVLLTNFYPMVDARRRFGRGTYPEQYLFGGRALEEAGHTVVYAQPAASRQKRALQRLTRLSRRRLGELDHELSALRAARGADVIYGMAEEAMVLPGLLRRAGGLRGTTLACVYQHPPRDTAIHAQVAQAMDLCLPISRMAEHGLLAAGRDPKTVVRIQWGPQLDFGPYHPAERADEYVMSCGKSARDIDTLAAALAADGLPGVIYAPPGWEAPPAADLRLRGTAPMPPYRDVMADMARAAVVAIPLRSTTVYYGLSELNDALAMGKPVVMTRTPHLDIDLDGEGCGITVELGDVEGWRAALARLWGDPELRREMGRRGRAFAEREWNARRCGEQITGAIERAAAARG
jgi:Glycosyl transferases group 1